MKKLMEGQKPAVKAEPMPRAIEDCFRDIAKGRAAITALSNALTCQMYNLHCKKKGRQYGICQSLGDVDMDVLNETIADLDGFRHLIAQTEYFLHKYNTTWRNDRSVELSAVKQFLSLHTNGTLLEFGNVL